MASGGKGLEEPRLRILRLLQRHPYLAVEDLARHLQMAPATVRRHLDVLQRDGLVAFRRERRRVGRPQHVYYLTEAGQESLPKHYSRLLSYLLEELSQVSEGAIPNGRGLVEFLLFRIAQRVADAHRERFVRRSLEERLEALREVLEAEEFAPEVSSADGETVIHLANCPFRQVARQHPALCAYDYHLIGAVLGLPIRRVRCVASGDDRCCYRVEAPSPPPD